VHAINLNKQPSHLSRKVWVSSEISCQVVISAHLYKNKAKDS